MDTLRPPRGKQTTAESEGLILKEGGVFFETPEDGVGTGAGAIKIGDGTTEYSKLPYFIKDNTESVEGILDGTLTVGKATTATKAGTSTYSTNSAKATSATSAVYSNHAVNADTATYASNCGTASYSSNSAKATSATNAGTATYSVNSGTASYASSSNNATTASKAGTATYATNSGTSVYSTNAGTSTYSTNSGSASKATSATSATYSSTATYSKNAGTSNYATKAGSANSASTATVDSAGNNINETYLKSASVSGKVVTFTKGNGSTFSIATQDTNTTYSNYKGATTASSGTAGLVPAATTATRTAFLRGDGTWSTPTNTTYGAATTTSAGLMSASDKVKLNAITDSADAVSFAQSLTSGTQVGTITINGTATKLYAPTNTDTHYTTGLIVGASSTANANAAATNGNVYMNVMDNTTVRNSHKITGSGSVTVTSDASGNITINGTDNNSDTKVTQTATTASANYPLLLAPAATTATTTTTSYFDSGVTLNPSTNTIEANISGTAAKATSATSATYSTTATKAGTATYATNSGTSTYATSAGSASKATSATSATYATTISGLTATVAELNYVDGVTSNIQTQLDNKAYGYKWSATIMGKTWSRICLCTPIVTTIGGSFLLNVGFTRGSVVGNATFLITSSHASSDYCHITQLSSNSYSVFKIRCVGKNDGTCYVEIYDNANSIATTTSQIVNCALVPLLNYTVTTYTAFTTGATIPSGYVAYEHTVTIGGALVAPKFVGNLTGNADTASSANSATSATKATSATIATSATYSSSAGSATNASTASYASSAGSATKATSATSATYASTSTKAGTSTYATNAGTAAYSSNGAKATSATSATYASTSTKAGTATYATNSGTSTYASNSRTYIGATTAASGTSGYVPAATTATRTRFLRGDGTWAVPTNTTYSSATTATAGLMTTAMVTKLNGIATGANAYTLPTASSSTLGGVKSGSTVTSTSGYTACPIISGVPYYKDTNTTYTLSSFGITATATELNYCDGVTGNIQTQLNAKSASTHTHSYLPLSGGTLTGSLTANGKIAIHSISSSWIDGMTISNASMSISKTQTESYYHPYLAVKTYGGHVFNMGGSGDKVGFYGYYSNRTVNGTDWSTYWDVNNGWLTHTGTLQLTNTKDASGTTSPTCALIVGSYSGSHLEFDGNEIQSKATATTTTGLGLNLDGGTVTIGSGGLQVKGTFTATNYQDSGWLSTTYNSTYFKNYNNDTTNAPHYRKVGDVVSVRGIASASTTITGSVTEYKMFTLPSGYRPTSTSYLVYVFQGTGRARWTCLVLDTGEVRFTRLCDDNGYSNATTATWLPYSFTFIV